MQWLPNRKLAVSLVANGGRLQPFFGLNLGITGRDNFVVNLCSVLVF